MKEYIVSIDILTESSVIEKQLSELFGLTGLKFNCRKTKSGLLWKIESNLGEEASLIDQIESIAMAFKNPADLSAIDKSIVKEVSLVIGVFCDTVTCTINFPVKCLALIRNHFPSCDVEITFYPCTEKKESAKKGKQKGDRLLF